MLSVKDFYHCYTLTSLGSCTLVTIKLIIKIVSNIIDYAEILKKVLYVFINDIAICFILISL